ncbi:MAG: 5-formyltetrahydrofolate cyclo-ligase [Halanaeroarchaeum sp.]
MDKQAIRERVWDDLADASVARFPFPPHGRIPNVAGADRAAERLAERPEWERATAFKSNPDAPQLPVRRRALHDGRTVYMAVPRLRDERCFMGLDPATIADLDAAPTVSHADEYATRVGPDALPHVDLIVAGSVAVSPAGDRIGKGEGYSDLEWAILAEAGLVDRETTVATTVHERQVVDDAFTPDAHDVPMDLVVTPERVLETDRREDRPEGIDWAALDEERIAEMPVLASLRERRG